MLNEKIAVITDGSLPTGSDLVSKVVPFYVHYQEIDVETRQLEWRDVRGDTVSPENFVEIQRISKKAPSTAQPSPYDFLRAYTEVIDQGYNCILVLTVPSSKSGTYNSATQAIGLFKEHRPKEKINFVVIDTGTTAAGVEYLVEEVIRLIGRGEFFIHIVERIEYLKSRVEIFFALDKIDYISASGRIEELSSAKLSETLLRRAKGLAAWFARTTHHSPKVALSFKEGKEKLVGISRFYPQAVVVMGQEIEQRALIGKDIKRIYLYQRGSETETKALMGRIALFSHAEIVVKEDLPIALLSILGPKFVALVCIYDHMH